MKRSIAMAFVGLVGLVTAAVAQVECDPPYHAESTLVNAICDPDNVNPSCGLTCGEIELFPCCDGIFCQCPIQGPCPTNFVGRSHVFYFPQCVSSIGMTHMCPRACDGCPAYFYYSPDFIQDCTTDTYVCVKTQWYIRCTPSS